MTTYIYCVYDDDHKIQNKCFDKFEDAFDYAQDGLQTYIEEIPVVDGVEQEDDFDVVWSWDDTWNREEAINNVNSRHVNEEPAYAPEYEVYNLYTNKQIFKGSKKACEKYNKEHPSLLANTPDAVMFYDEHPELHNSNVQIVRQINDLDEDVEIEVKGEPDEVASLAKCLLGDDCEFFDQDFDMPEAPVPIEKIELKPEEPTFNYDDENKVDLADIDETEPLNIFDKDDEEADEKEDVNVEEDNEKDVEDKQEDEEELKESSDPIADIEKFKANLLKEKLTGIDADLDAKVSAEIGDEGIGDLENLTEELTGIDAELDAKVSAEIGDKGVGDLDNLTESESCCCYDVYDTCNDNIIFVGTKEECDTYASKHSNGECALEVKEHCVTESVDGLGKDAAQPLSKKDALKDARTYIDDETKLDEAQYTSHVEDGYAFGVEASSASEASKKVKDKLEKTSDKDIEVKDIKVDSTEVSNKDKDNFFKELLDGDISDEPYPQTLEELNELSWKYAGFKCDKDDFERYNKMLNNDDLTESEFLEEFGKALIAKRK